jgi:hypothetical protein
MTPTEKAIRDFCGHHADWWPSTTQVQEMLALAQDEFKPDYNTEAVLVEEMQRMAKRIQELETEQDCVGWFGYDTSLRLWFETNKGDDGAIPLYKARSKT